MNSINQIEQEYIDQKYSLEIERSNKIKQVQNLCKHQDLVELSRTEVTSHIDGFRICKTCGLKEDINYLPLTMF